MVSAAQSKLYSMAGLPFTKVMHLFVWEESPFNRFPRPPASISAFIALSVPA